jgi:4-diphosphocytidyl-2-C-methyl-D-erythritol kinase
VTERISLSAPAKINLSLRILGKRPDGFHELESLMAPVNLADQIEIAHGAGGEITFLCNDPELPLGADNLCVKAAEAFREATGLDHGISITLLKRIPHGAGLGGGSSDAASVLKGLNELYDTPLVEEELRVIGSTLGSDIPFFFGHGPALCRGRGEILEPANDLPSRRLLLIKPPFPVSTAWAYKRYAELKAHGSHLSGEDSQYLDALEITNDLEAPVFEKYLLLPVLKKWLRQQPGVESAFMTGSGSTVVAVIDPRTHSAMPTSLMEEISVQFGSTFWMAETSWKNQDELS